MPCFSRGIAQMFVNDGVAFLRIMFEVIDPYYLARAPSSSSLSTGYHQRHSGVYRYPK